MYGHLTIPQEYELQLYERGHTIFGKWTLGASQNQFDMLLKELKKRTC